ncbi:MAG: LutB/LldF family L-lactate oxidation iron-sulfur protein [Planctomycetota bacterium]
MTASGPPASFAARARAALGDDRLRQALGKATALFAARRRTALAEVPDWEELRQRAARIKREALNGLHHYLEQFAANAETAGAEIHWARDAAEACAIVSSIARRIGARHLVKAKSMTTEEIGLNAALERDGRLPVETDLGEWIIQLAGEPPSHIIVPAIHKSRADVAALFAAELGIPPTDDVAELTRAARVALRQRFAAAELGISGVNFAVAETGSILILENEGNARMATTLPRVHVAIVGIEKIVPRFEHLAVFLRLLPRSGTGQHLTTYQSILTGPSAIVGDEGPEELHIVLLDNGRTAMLASDETRPALACIRCGACLNACPVYREIGGHAYGSTYPGPIGAVITPLLAGLERGGDLAFASSLCGACREVCPVDIDLPGLLIELRSRVVEGRRRGELAGGRAAAFERRAIATWAWAMASPRRYRLLSRLARALPGPWRRGGRPGRLAARLIPALRAWGAARDLRPLAPRTFRDLWREDEG